MVVISGYRVCNTCEHWGKNGWAQHQVGYCPEDSRPHKPNDFCSSHILSREIRDVIQYLRQLGFSVKEAKEAAVCAKGDKLLAFAYAKAKVLPLATPGLNFEERVRRFYELEKHRT